MVFSTFFWGQVAKLCQHGWKESLKISKVAKFESDLLTTNKNIAPQSRCGRQVCAPHHTNVCKSNVAVLWGNIFAVFGCFTFQLGRLPYFKALYPAVLMDILFKYTALYRKLKERNGLTSLAIYFLFY